MDNEMYFRLTDEEQKEIRIYIRDRIEGKPINTESLPVWLAGLENTRILYNKIPLFLRRIFR